MLNYLEIPQKAALSIYAEWFTARLAYCHIPFHNKHYSSDWQPWLLDYLVGQVSSRKKIYDYFVDE